MLILDKITIKSPQSIPLLLTRMSWRIKFNRVRISCHKNRHQLNLIWSWIWKRRIWIEIKTRIKVGDKLSFSSQVRATIKLIRRQKKNGKFLKHPSQKVPFKKIPLTNRLSNTLHELQSVLSRLVSWKLRGLALKSWSKFSHKTKLCHRRDRDREQLQGSYRIGGFAKYRHRPNLAEA